MRRVSPTLYPSKYAMIECPSASVKFINKKYNANAKKINFDLV